MKPSKDCKELLCLDVSDLYLLILAACNASRVSDDSQGIAVDSPDFVLAIQRDKASNW